MTAIQVLHRRHTDERSQGTHGCDDAGGATQTAAPPAVSRPGVGVWLVTLIACLAQFMVVLDTAIVNVALPAMRHDLALSISDQQWVVDAYLLTFGGLLLFGARAGDLYGRRRVFQIGLAVFTLASLAGGLAPDGSVLLIARALQGVGAAALAPASLSLLMAAHPEPGARARALGIWAMAASSAAAVGVVLGGVLTEVLDWRYVMFVNVPVGVGLFGATAYGLAPATKGAATRVKLDVPGALTATVGLSAAVYGISQANHYGWGSSRVLIAMIGAVVVLAAFILTESRSAQPLVRLGILGLRNMRAANLAMLGFGTTLTASLFFLSLYLQQLLGYSAIKTGLALLPMTVVLGAGNFVTRSLLARGVKHLAVAGALTAAGGMLWLTQLPAHPDYAGSVLLPTLMTGAGFSLAMLPVISAGTNGVAHHESGMASGLLERLPPGRRRAGSGDPHHGCHDPDQPRPPRRHVGRGPARLPRRVARRGDRLPAHRGRRKSAAGDGRSLMPRSVSAIQTVAAAPPPAVAIWSSRRPSEIHILVTAEKEQLPM